MPNFTSPFTSASASAPSGSVQKFQFDDFDMGEAVSEVFEFAVPVQPDPIYTPEDMSLARLAGETAGFRRGVEEMQASLDGEVARLLAEVLAGVGAAVEEQKSQRDLVSVEAVRLAACIARKVLPAMAEAGALREVEALIVRCLSERPEEARLVIRLHDALLDPVRGRMEQLAVEAGFAGRPILLADPALKRSEIRIEWANGGVDWSFERQLTDLEGAVHRLTTAARTRRPKPGPVVDLNEETE